MSKSVNGLLVLGVAVFLGFKFSLPVFHVHPKGAILITGASSGIGLDAAKELIKQGYTGTVKLPLIFRHAHMHHSITLYPFHYSYLS